MTETDGPALNPVILAHGFLPDIQKASARADEKSRDAAAAQRQSEIADVAAESASVDLERWQAAAHAAMKAFEDAGTDELFTAHMLIEGRDEETAAEILNQIDAVNRYIEEDDNPVIGVVGYVFGGRKTYSTTHKSLPINILLPASDRDGFACNLVQEEGGKGYLAAFSNTNIYRVTATSPSLTSGEYTNAPRELRGSCPEMSVAKPVEDVAFLGNAQEVAEYFNKSDRPNFGVSEEADELHASPVVLYGVGTVEAFAKLASERSELLRPFIYSTLRRLGLPYEGPGLETDSVKEKAQQAFLAELESYILQLMPYSREVGKPDAETIDDAKYTFLNPNTQNFIGLSGQAIIDAVAETLRQSSYPVFPHKRVWGAVANVTSFQVDSPPSAWSTIWIDMKRKGFGELAVRQLRNTALPHDIEREVLEEVLASSVLSRRERRQARRGVTTAVQKRAGTS